MWHMFIKCLFQGKTQTLLEWGLLLLNSTVMHFSATLLLAGVAIWKSDWYEDVSIAIGGIQSGQEEGFTTSHAIVILCSLAVIVVLLLIGVCVSMWSVIKMGIRQEVQGNALLEAIGYGNKYIKLGMLLQQGLLVLLAAIPGWGISEFLYALLKRNQALYRVLKYSTQTGQIQLLVHGIVPIVLILMVWILLLRNLAVMRKRSIIKRLYDIA
jgi:hypothetical protein